MPLNLANQHVKIREWTVQDAPQLLARAKDFHLDLTSAEMAELLVIDWALKFTQTKMGVLPIFDLANHLVGLASLLPVKIKGESEMHFEVMIQIAEPFSNNGFGTNASHLMIEYAFKNLGLQEIVSLKAHANPYAKKMVDRLGLSFLKKGRVRESMVEVYHLKSV